MRLLKKKKFEKKAINQYALTETYRCIPVRLMCLKIPSQNFSELMKVKWLKNLLLLQKFTKG